MICRGTFFVPVNVSRIRKFSNNYRRITDKIDRFSEKGYLRAGPVGSQTLLNALLLLKAHTVVLHGGRRSLGSQGRQTSSRAEWRQLELRNDLKALP